MPTLQPNCCYHKVFGEKRKGQHCLYDLKLTVGFSPNTRWIHPRNSDVFIEFGLTRADLHLNLVNGVVDLEEGDKLGGKLQLNVQKKISSSEKAADKTTVPKFGTTMSFIPSVKIDSGGVEGHEEKSFETEINTIYCTVHSNFSDFECPFWTFIPIESRLGGSLTMAPLCTVKVKGEADCLCNSILYVHPNDIDITCLPKGWTNILPFQGLRTSKIKHRIIKSMSESGTELDSQGA